MTASNKSPIRLHIEGWRGISHSYALVNQFQIMHWRKHHHAQIKHSDMPFIMAHWANGDNSAGFTEADLAIIQSPEFDGAADAVYRIYAPLNLEAHVTLPTLTFAVTEFGLGTKDLDLAKISRYATQGGLVHTPSQWSKRRLVANGIPNEIIHVVGHAVDPTYFRELSASQISENRSNLGFAPEDIVLLNVGTHHWNKGLDLLIKAFAQARKSNKNLKLLLKDQRSTYLVNSESYVQQVLSEIGLFDQDLLDSIRMISGHLTLAQLNSLYSVADAYVTPYRAEGFNLPALEAQACGTPVIATLGGATDDFLHPSTTTAISGALIENSHLKDDLPVNAYIEPSLELLTHTLQNVERKPEHAVNTSVQSWTDVCQQINRILSRNTESYRFTLPQAAVQFIIFCDGGVGNRINALVTGLAVAHQLGLTYRIHWPVNNWCAAPFSSIFANTEPISEVSISGLRGMLDDAHMLLHDDIASNVLGVGFHSAYRFETIDDFANQCVVSGKPIFYYPAIMPAWVPETLIHAELRALKFTTEITNAVTGFIHEVMAEPFHGIHLRRTDLNVGLTDQEVFTLVRQYPNEKFFVCSDDPAAEALASAHPNVYHRAKSHAVEKKTEGQDWLAAKHDDDGRLYHGNIQRSEAAVIEGTIDMLILAHSEIVGYSGSTFQRMARLIGEVCPLMQYRRPSLLAQAIHEPDNRLFDKTANKQFLHTQNQVHQPMENPNITTQTIYGEIIVNKNDFIGTKIIEEGYWEIDDVRLVELIMLELIKRKNRDKVYFYDIGANIGTYSLAIAKLNNSIEVISFEAQTQVFYMLCGTVALNGIRNIRCLNVALSDIANETLEIRIPDYNSKGSFGSIELIAPVHSDNQDFKFLSIEKVNTTTIDSMDEAVDFLKIDVEGMEDKVLKGGYTKIEKYRPVIFVEIYKTDRDFVKNYLIKLNYILYIDNYTLNLLALPRELGLAITNSKWHIVYA